MKEKPKELSEYDRSLLLMSRENNNFIFASDLSDHLFKWLLDNRFKKVFKTYKDNDKDCFKDMLHAFKKASEHKAKEKILHGLSLFLNSIIDEIHEDKEFEDHLKKVNEKLKKKED